MQGDGVAPGFRMRPPTIDRRGFLGAVAAAAAAEIVRGQPALGALAGPKRLGLTDASYALRRSLREAVGPFTPLRTAVDMLETAARLGAGCVQTSVRRWQAAYAERVRDLRESLGILLEGQISLPRTDADLERFAAEARAAREAGAQVLRTVCLSGRRYERFASLEAWEEFRAASWDALTRAEPVVRRLGLVLAVENHKDWRTEELIDLMRRLDSEAVGVCLDTGNNIALLENPLETVRALAPFARTTHLKDMALREYEDGFLLAEVPLGAGYLDLPLVVRLCEAENPSIQFNLEMITRDPLRVPVLEQAYWTTFPALSGSALATTLATARAAGPAALQSVSALRRQQQLALEESNVRESFVYARERLKL